MARYRVSEDHVRAVISQNLRRLRGDMQIGDFCREHGLVESTYRKNEQGAFSPKLSRLMEYAKALGVSISEIVEPEIGQEDEIQADTEAS